MTSPHSFQTHARTASQIYTLPFNVSPHRMEAEGPLPQSQVPTTCPYPEPEQSNPCPPSHFLKIHFNIIPHLCLGLPSGLLPSRLPPKPCMYLSCSPYVQHAPPHPFYKCFYHPNNIWWGVQIIKFLIIRKIVTQFPYHIYKYAFPKNSQAWQTCKKCLCENIILSMSSVYIWWYWSDIIIIIIIIIRDKLIFETNIQSSHGSEYYYCRLPELTLCSRYTGKVI